VARDRFYRNRIPRTEVRPSWSDRLPLGASFDCALRKTNPGRQDIWRRGWDSDSILWLNPRKLLIPRNGRTAKNDQIAEVRYTAGTRSRVVEQLN